ncbi:MAG TPA: Rv2175c family DNA-binding protein [Microbacteriaceae bacterium]|nr:Rv2175c family DNA-binding protein [Microbacteriaceae bacterium]
MTFVQDSWLTLDDAARMLSVGVGRVRRLIEEHRLAAIRVQGKARIPQGFVRDGKPLPELRGTLIALSDAGFDNDEAVDWLLRKNDDLDATPLEALRDGRSKMVRWNIQTLG